LRIYNAYIFKIATRYVVTMQKALENIK